MTDSLFRVMWAYAHGGSTPPFSTIDI